MNKATSILVLFVCALGLLTPNPLLTVVSVLSLAFFIKLFWRPGEPPILLFCMVFQWIQGTVLVFYADFQGLHLTAVDDSPAIVNGTW